MSQHYTVRTTRSDLYGRALTFVAPDDDGDTFVVDFDWMGVGTIEGDAAIDPGDARVIAANDPDRTMFQTTPIPIPPTPPGPPKPAPANKPKAKGASR